MSKDNVGKYSLIPQTRDCAQRLLDYIQRNNYPAYVYNFNISPEMIQDFLDGKRDDIALLTIQFIQSEETDGR